MARFVWHDEQFAPQIRRSSGMIAWLGQRGLEWTADLNAELKAAQAKRRQPVEDGYKYYVHVGGTRARLYIVAATARAQAHEAKHNSILKLMKTSGLDVNRTGREFKNPGKGWLIHGTDEQGNPIIDLND